MVESSLTPGAQARSPTFGVFSASLTQRKNTIFAAKAQMLPESLVEASRRQSSPAIDPANLVGLIRNRNCRK